MTGLELICACWSVYVEATVPAWVNPETGDVVSVAELLTKARGR